MPEVGNGTFRVEEELTLMAPLLKFTLVHLHARRDWLVSVSEQANSHLHGEVVGLGLAVLANLTSKSDTSSVTGLEQQEAK